MLLAVWHAGTAHLANGLATASEAYPANQPISDPSLTYGAGKRTGNRPRHYWYKGGWWQWNVACLRSVVTPLKELLGTGSNPQCISACAVCMKPKDCLAKGERERGGPRGCCETQYWDSWASWAYGRSRAQRARPGQGASAQNPPPPTSQQHHWLTARKAADGRLRAS